MKNFNKLALIVVLGSGFAVAQGTMPQSTAPSSSPAASQPSSTDQTPAVTPDQGKNPANAPETLPSTDQKPADSSKLPQSDASQSAAPAASGDVQGNIQSAIQKDPSLASSNVTVNVMAGKSVELTGTVASKDAKDAAERIATENSGGLKVKNHLKISGGSSDMSTPKTDTSAPAPKH
ncbi:MAG TPA: BON domain-containing protein [Candidatus Angelobacter sp.]|jgi:cytoskeletal protein RodZ